MYFTSSQCLLQVPPTSSFLISITVIIFSEEYKLWSSFLCKFLYLPTISSPLVPDFLLCTLFSVTPQTMLFTRCYGTKFHSHMKQDVIWFCIAQWYSAGPRAGWSGVRVLSGAGNFSLHHHVKTGSGAYPTSYPMGARGSFPGSKAAGTSSWPLISIYCQRQEWVDLYIHSLNTP
jgi:hypothetical protein